MNTKDYLEKAKESLGITSDYALAPRLGITRSYISALQNGKQHFSDKLCYQIAEITGIHPAIILVDTYRQKSETPAQSKVWSDVMEKISVGFKVLMTRRTPRPI
ncbi:MAG: helix-turn-helix domain-containing protein [Gammaproteobacteria bacterium]|nr:helix-turn-helix domain-containing protein [Gammaproteobacteria bacterium]